MHACQKKVKTSSGTAKCMHAVELCKYASMQRCIIYVHNHGRLEFFFYYINCIVWPKTENPWKPLEKKLRKTSGFWIEKKTSGLPLLGWKKLFILKLCFRFFCFPFLQLCESSLKDAQSKIDLNARYNQRRTNLHTVVVPENTKRWDNFFCS